MECPWKKQKHGAAFGQAKEKKIQHTLSQSLANSSLHNF